MRAPASPARTKAFHVGMAGSFAFAVASAGGRCADRPPNSENLSLQIFLWAWPVRQVTLRWLAPGTPDAARYGLIVAQATVLAWLSWRFTEQPAQRRKPAKPPAPPLESAAARAG